MGDTWRADAACQGQPLATFFPVDASILAAKQFCRVCPVTAECLEFALEVGSVNGVYGGTSGRERGFMLDARNS